MRTTAARQLTFAPFPDQQDLHNETKRKTQQQAGHRRYVLPTFVMTLIGHIENTLRGQQNNQNPYSVERASEGREQRHIVAGNVPSHACYRQSGHDRDLPPGLCSATRCKRPDGS